VIREQSGVEDLSVDIFMYRNRRRLGATAIHDERSVKEKGHSFSIAQRNTDINSIYIL